MVLLGGFEDESSVQVSSPRTVAFLNASSSIVASSTSLQSSTSSSSRGMTTNVTVMNDGNEVGSVVEVEEKKMVTPTTSKDAADSSAFRGTNEGGKSKGSPSKASAPIEDDEEASPQSQDPSEAHLAAGYPHLLPQPGSNAAYYLGYNPAEPPSPSTAGMATISYDAAAFFQQPGAFAPLTRAAAAAANAAGSPMSPPRTLATMTVVPPASPLFPRATSSATRLAAGDRHPVGIAAAPPSPGLAYVSPALGGYHQQAYSVVPTVGGSHSGDSPDGAWGERYVLHRDL
jgi:hypothetical protein